MIGRVVTILAACALALPAFCADDAFVGTWKYNKDKSDEKGQIQSIADLGNNKYKFTFGTISFDITADGTDQASMPGATLAITIADANTWQYVAKVNGKTLGTGVWTLAADGKSIADEFKGTRPDGSQSETHTKMTRVAGNKGFAGTWRVAEATFTDPGPMVISAYGKDGLSISNPAYKLKMDLTMDGKECTPEGPTVLPGMTTSGKRNGPKSISMTDKQNAKVLDTEVWKVSADGKMLTITHHDEGVKKATVSVYEKQ
jgi:hypothetical protein